MLKSNCKKALENIRAYILEKTDVSNYEEFEQPKTWKDAARIVYKCFMEEKRLPCLRYEMRRGMSEQESFVDWAQGLPSVFDTCYYYNRSAVDDLGRILEETEEEKARYTEADAEKMLSYLLYREIVKGARV